jgi:ferric iron reductase protein FhuF
MSMERAFGFLAEQGLDRLGAALAPCSTATGAIGGDRLLGPDALELALGPLRRQQPEAPPRALLSLWSRHYFFRLIPPVVLTLLLAHRDWPLDLRHSGVRLNGEGLPDLVALPEPGATRSAPDCSFARFAPLVQDHLAPLIQALAPAAGLAPRVLWANAAGYFSWAVRQLAEDPALPPGCAAPGLAVLHSPLCPDGSPNPLFEPMRVQQGPRGPQPYRKVCCLLYQLPGRGECSSCPLPCARRRDATC